jgi:hypothetical protein
VQVKALLTTARDAGAIVTALPDMLDPACLVRTLVYVRSAFGGQDPVAILQRQLASVNNMMWESEIEDSAEYGELSKND